MTSPAEEVDGPDVSGRSPERRQERRLARPVRPEDRATFAGYDVEVDVTDGVKTAETPADPPQAESRLGALGEGAWSSDYSMACLVITPFLTTWTCPVQGYVCFTQGGWLRPGGGVVFLKKPPNDWSTPGTYATTRAVGLPSLPLTICCGYWSAID